MGFSEEQKKHLSPRQQRRLDYMKNYATFDRETGQPLEGIRRTDTRGNIITEHHATTNGFGIIVRSIRRFFRHVKGKP